MLRQDKKAALPFLPSVSLIREMEMEVEVVFGTPSKNCSGAGICMISSRFPKTFSIPCPHAPAHIHYLPESELVFRFKKQYLSTQAIRTYFNKRDFLVEEAFRLPRFLVRRWNLPLESIPPGRYSLEEYSREWRLYFPI